MKTYSPFARYISGDYFGDMEEDEGGEWVRHDDAQAEIERLRALLIRARKFVEDDALMAGAITRHAPLPPEAQAIHDSTEYLSEILLREIDAALIPPTEVERQQEGTP